MASVEAWDAVMAAYPQAKEAYDKALAEWQTAADAAKAAGTACAETAQSRPRGGDAFGSPGCLYNGMIASPAPVHHPRRDLVSGRVQCRAAPISTQKLFPTMIQSWRQRWNVGEFPFLFVQLANFMQRHRSPRTANWAALREAQLKTLDLPHTGMAVAIDIGEAKDIHPKNKQEVGRRLALAAWPRSITTSANSPARSSQAHRWRTARSASASATRRA